MRPRVRCLKLSPGLRDEALKKPATRQFQAAAACAGGWEAARHLQGARVATRAQAAALCTLPHRCPFRLLPPPPQPFWSPPWPCWPPPPPPTASTTAPTPHVSDIGWEPGPLRGWRVAAERHACADLPPLPLPLPAGWWVVNDAVKSGVPATLSLCQVGSCSCGECGALLARATRRRLLPPLPWPLQQAFFAVSCPPAALPPGVADRVDAHPGRRQEAAAWCTRDPPAAAGPHRTTLPLM